MALTSDALNIFEELYFDESITKYDYHVYQPTSHNYANNDEIRILLQHQDILTIPSESFLRIEYSVKINAEATYSFGNNAVAFLFGEIRYEMNGIEIERIKDVGMSSLIKGLLSLSKTDASVLQSAGWNTKQEATTLTAATGAVTLKKVAHIPLKCLLGFAEDYRKFIMNTKQELILLRSSSDNDFIKSTKAFKVEISKIEWYVPRIEVNDETKLRLYNKLKSDPKIFIPFRRHELHMLPSLRTVDRDVWSVKTSSALERPRYIILGFQTSRRNVMNAAADEFDHCNMRNIKIYLNSESYPYNDLQLNITNDDYALLYHMYSQYQVSYYGNSKPDPLLTFDDFKKQMLFVFDVSKQKEELKSSFIDLKIELEAREAFNADTRGYCLIISDCVVEYTPLTGIVRKLVQ